MFASPYQERFWLEWQLNPSSAAYNESLVYDVKGPLKLDVLKLALSGLMHKHPFLRSQFYKNEIEHVLCVQFIENFKLPLEFVDVKEEKLDPLKEIASQIINIPFDLSCGPLWRVRVLQLGDQWFWLVFSFHHIIIDGNSFDIIRHGLSQFYNQPTAIKQLKNTQVYNIELKEHIEKDVGFPVSQGLQYYEEKLVNKPLHYDLGSSSCDGTTFFFSLGKQISKSLGNKPFRLLAAIFSIFLYKYFGQKKFCITYPVNMRKNTNKDVLGSFINMQLFPIELESNSSFDHVFSQIVEGRKVTQELLLPYEKIIQHLKRRGIIEHSDSSNVVISETDLKLRPLDLHSLQIVSVQLPKTFLPYDMALEYEFYSDNVYFQLSVKNHWFNFEHHGEQLKKDFCSIIEFSQRYPQEPLYRLSLAEFKLPDISEFQTCNIRIEEKFDQIVDICPDKIAVIGSNKKITYSQLVRMADLIATNLIPMLSSKIELVGVTLPHGPELIAVMIALFKLGKSYLPIRHDLPASYVNEIINQSKLKFIITDEVLKDLLIDVPIIADCIKNDNYNDVAYVLYTSGTTGVPKGVVVKHTSVVTLISSCQSFYRFSSDDVIPWFHSYAFDFSVWEIWSALLNGGTLLVLDEFVIKSPREFTKQISQYHVTSINQTPTALKQWVTYLYEANEALPDLSSIRLLITGGEALYPHHVERLLLSKTPLQCQIYNMYGITEDCVHSTIFEITSSYLKQRYSIIGKMLPGKYGMIVDENNNVKPTGCPGELLISGFGVAKGYFNQSLITKEKFIQIFGKSWFRTGDQVRMLPSGDFEYLGRNDAQIKIRGHRIDCKDIEVRLSRLAGVLDVKIVAEGNDELLAFLVLEQYITITAVIALSKSSLPYYMFPSKFIKIDVMPRTINNKIDEKKLLEINKMESEEKFFLSEQITDPTLLKITEIWKMLLPNRSFGVGDNFFDCGGNSLLLAVLQNHLEKCFLVQLPIAEFFSHPSITEMAKMVEKYFIPSLIA